MSGQTDTKHWRIAPIEARHAPEVQRLFQAVFGHPMSPAMWHWKYGDNNGHAVGVWNANGELIAHYGGMRHRAYMDGRTIDVVQVGDVMVLRTAHKTLVRRGPAFLAASHFLTQWIGYEKPFLLGYGFPSRIHHLLLERLGLYRSVGRVFELRKRVVTHVRDSRWWRIERLTAMDIRHSKAIDRLWQEMRVELADKIVIERDAAHIQKRYFLHPEHRYHIFLMRRPWLRRAQALFILRSLPMQPERCELLDWIASSDMVATVIQNAAAAAARLGARELFCWASDPVCALLEPLMDEVIDIQVDIPTNVWTPGPAPETLQGRWWLTGGDTDFH